MKRPDLRAWEVLAYRGALLTYVIALILVVVIFPGVSNLWVSIFILVSGLFSLLADYAAATRDRKEDGAEDSQEAGLCVACDHPEAEHFRETGSCLHQTETVIWACGCHEYREKT